MKNINFNLPYKVKIKTPEQMEKSIKNTESVEQEPIEHVEEPIVEEIPQEETLPINFSIIVLIENNIEYLTDTLPKLREFRDRGGDVCILNIKSDDNSLVKDFRIEDGSSFIREVDEDMAEIINLEFNDGDEQIIKNGNTYIDYSSLKNYASTLVSSDLVLFLEPNIHFVAFNITETINNINDFELINIIANDSKKNISIYNKTFFTWEGIINEKLIKNDSNIRTTELERDILSIDVINEKSRINLQNISISCYLDKSNERFSYLLATELFNNKLYNSALKEFNRHLSLTKSKMKRAKTMVFIGEIYILTNRDKEGLNYFHNAYLECSEIRSPLFKLGHYFYFKGERDKSIFYLEGCLNIPLSPKEKDYDEFIYKDGPHSMLYVAHWWLGNTKKGKYYFDKALELNPYNKLYIDEAIYHYKYKGNTIHGDSSFQELQYLNSQSKKMNSILEIYPDNCRSTEALLNGCDGLITVILNEEQNNVFLETLNNPGNLKILNITTGDAIKKFINENEKFDMIFFNGDYNKIISDNVDYVDLYIWEQFTNKLICGNYYENFNILIDKSFEIDDKKEKIWYKTISKFEKTITYKIKNKNYG